MAHQIFDLTLDIFIGGILATVGVFLIGSIIAGCSKKSETKKVIGVIIGIMIILLILDAGIMLISAGVSLIV